MECSVLQCSAETAFRQLHGSQPPASIPVSPQHSCLLGDVWSQYTSEELKKETKQKKESQKEFLQFLLFHSHQSFAFRWKLWTKVPYSFSCSFHQGFLFISCFFLSLSEETARLDYFMFYSLSFWRNSLTGLFQDFSEKDYDWILGS